MTAIKAWIEFDGEGDTLFCSSKGQEFRSDVISTDFKNLSNEVCKIEAQRKGGISVEGWTLKHLRNVGSSLGKLHKRPMDERQVFLGHLAQGTNVFYEDPDLGPEYLLDLVNLVGTEYFGGEQVKKFAGK